MIADKPDAHRMLLNPDKLAEAFEGLDCTAAAQLLGQLTAYLRTATQVDGVAVIDELAFVCAADRPGQSALRNLSHAVSEFVASCIQFVGDDDMEIAIVDFVSIVPLVCGYDVLCKVGAAHGLVRRCNADKLGSAKRHVADGQAIEHAIEVWRQRATRVIESGYVMEEGSLLVFLDGLARLGVGATDADALAALCEFCTRVPAGLPTFSNKFGGNPLTGCTDSKRGRIDEFRQLSPISGICCYISSQVGGFRGSAMSAAENEHPVQRGARRRTLWPHKSENCDLHGQSFEINELKLSHDGQLPCSSAGALRFSPQRDTAGALAAAFTSAQPSDNQLPGRAGEKDDGSVRVML